MIPSEISQNEQGILQIAMSRAAAVKMVTELMIYPPLILLAAAANLMSLPAEVVSELMDVFDKVHFVYRI